MRKNSRALATVTSAREKRCGASIESFLFAFFPPRTGDDKQREIIFLPLAGTISRFTLSCRPDYWGEVCRIILLCASRS